MNQQMKGHTSSSGFLSISERSVDAHSNEVGTTVKPKRKLRKFPNL